MKALKTLRKIFCIFTRKTMKTFLKSRKYVVALHILAIIGLIGLVLQLTSCRTAQYHFDKFQKKGGKIECDIDTVKIVDTLVTIKGDTILQVRDSLIYQPFTNYITKWETKYLYKTKRDSFETVRYVKKFDAKKAVKVAKHENKRSNVLIWVLFGFVLNYLIRLIYQRLKK